MVDGVARCAGESSMKLGISIWVAVGAIAGIVHSFSLWRATHRAPVLGSGFRLLAVGGLFTAAALLGGIVPAAAGWILGFPAAALLLYVRRSI